MDSLEEWDNNISPLLFGISADLAWMRFRAEEVLRRVKQLLRRPEWQSNAEAETDKLIAETQQILDLLQEAKGAYKEKGTFK
jgi:hypothetical protein